MLADAALRAVLTLRFGTGGTRQLQAASTGVEGAVGRLLGIAHEAVAEGTWSRLKICRADTCAWAFYDTSRNRSGKWCSMAVCGNRAVDIGDGRPRAGDIYTGVLSSFLEAGFREVVRRSPKRPIVRLDL